MEERDIVYVIGIDPGLSGALSFFKIENGSRSLLGVRDMPAMANPFGKGNVINCIELAKLLRPFEGHNVIAILESVNARPTDGGAAAFKFGTAAMAPEALCFAFGFKVKKITPGVWKRRAGLLKQSKGASIAKALVLYPDKAQWFSRKKDEGRAEAVLIVEHSGEHYAEIISGQGGGEIRQAS